MYSPLIENMIETYGYPVVTEEDIDVFLDGNEQVVLFFTENANNYPESNDVAIILPELMKVFGGHLVAAVVHRESERPLQRRYRFRGYPALVFLHNGQYLGAITKVRNWTEYLDEFKDILASDVSEPPAFDLDKICPGSATA